MIRIFKLFTTADLILILLLLIISGVIFAEMKTQLTDQKVEIRYHNKLIGTYSLNESRIIDLDEGIQIEIARGKVRMKENTCAHQYCVQQGWSNTFPIICVPNEISIVILGQPTEMLITR